jgi:hypothetical protein
MAKGEKYIEDFTNRIPARYGLLDNEGIPLFDLKRLRLPSKLVYHPIKIIQYGLGNYQLSMDGSQTSETNFWRCTQWVEKNITPEPQGRFGGLYYSFPLLSMKVSPPWLSGMAQGQALSLLTRAYRLKPTVATAAAARSVAQSFLYTIEEGGILQPTPAGYLFIEEVAWKPTDHILNGALYALFGLYEYLNCFDDAYLLPQYEKCLAGIREMLPQFDLGWWSCYSLGVRRNLATLYYHDVHILLLNRLGSLLQEEIFLHYAKQWEISRASSWNRLKCSLLVFSKRISNLFLFLRLNSMYRLKYRSM